MDNELWEKLLDIQTLKLGWHLARRDTRQDFLNLPYYVDAYAVHFHRKLLEIQRLLATDTFAPSPLILVEVPKGTLAMRPGSVPSFSDRIVLQSVVALMAPAVDKQLSDAVYSYRLRDKKPDARHGLFKESDAIDLPYLKGRTISRELDPFESWYNAWPEFDHATKTALEEDGYTYLAVSDISAYFENIQLPILRDRLFELFPHDHKVVNLLFMFLETWSTRTPDGRHHWRGIPQGTQIGSFLGNVFLLPLDRTFAAFCEAHNALYFRYMDDVKIFAREYSVARLALLTMDRVLRKLHLNSQSAKTLILKEHPAREISHRLLDERLDALDKVFQECKSGNEINTAVQHGLVQRLHAIGRHRPRSSSEQPIIGARKPLKDMSFRVFRRWITGYRMLGEHTYVTRLIAEIERNPDYRLTRTLVSTARRFPQKRTIASWLASFVRSSLNIYPHQEAELLWAARYLARIPREITRHCEDRVLDPQADFYVRIQAAQLLAWMRLSVEFLRCCGRTVYRREKSSRAGIPTGPSSSDV